MNRPITLAALAGISLVLASAFAQVAPPATAPAATPAGFPGGRGGRGGGPLPPPNTNLNYQKWAPTPPMGWNSWDSYGAGVWEADVLANADYMEKNLKSYGWNLITIDIQWYEPLAHTTTYREGAILETDGNGRLLPAPNRFPLTKDSHSFKPIADLMHQKGLKLGIHLMRGIPRQSVDRDNVPILGTNLHAADIVDKQTLCGWNHDMYGVDMSKPGAQEYYNSVFKQIADWEVDFVKVDDLSGRNPEIQAIRKAIDHSGRQMIFSISPGGGSNDFVASNANLWRISGDFWDSWSALYSQFARLDQVTPFRGPGHWPDADMIPFGNVRTWKPEEAWTHFTKDEHYMLMSAWCIARSPLILGGNLPKNDEFELSMLTNDEVLAVNQKSTNNKQVFSNNNQIAWVADVPESKDKYVALFNANPTPPPGGGRGRGARGPRGAAANGPATAPQLAGEPAPTINPATTNPALLQPANVTLSLADIGITGPVKVRDLWTHQDLGTMNSQITAMVNSHGAVLYRIQQQN